MCLTLTPMLIIILGYFNDREHTHYGYVWFLENTKKRKKNAKEMIFLCLVIL